VQDEWPTSCGAWSCLLPSSHTGAHGEPADQGQESTLRGDHAASVVQPNVQLLEHSENLRIKGRKHYARLCRISTSAKYSTSYIEAHWEPVDQGQGSTLRRNYAASAVQPNVQLLEHNENLRIKGRKHSTRDHGTSIVQPNVLLPVLKHIENLRIKGRKHSTQGLCSILSSAKYSTSYNEAHWEPADQGQESTHAELCSICSSAKCSSSGAQWESADKGQNALYVPISLVRPNILLPILEHIENLRIKGRKHITQGSCSIVSSAKYSTS
jgi:hypothetical protein